MIQSRQWTLSWTYILTKAVLTDALLPLEELKHGFPMAQHQAQLAYAESFSFVSFIGNEFGPSALPRLIRGMAHGLDADTATMLATGLGLSKTPREALGQPAGGVVVSGGSGQSV